MSAISKLGATNVEPAQILRVRKAVMCWPATKLLHGCRTTELPVLSSHENQSRPIPESETGGVTTPPSTYDIARLTESLFLHGKEGLATQLGATGHADEAVHVEDLVHGGAAGSLAHHVLSTASTAACGDTEDGKLRACPTPRQRSDNTARAYVQCQHFRHLSESCFFFLGNSDVMMTVIFSNTVGSN